MKNYKVADCCCPIPGDDVLGYVEDDETVVVHKRECPVAMRLKSSFGPRLVSTQWEASESLSFPAKIEIQGIDRIGILNEITRVISNELIIDMRGLTIKANEGVFTGTVNIMVHDTRVVESLCNKLRKIKGVQKVARSDIGYLFLPERRKISLHLSGRETVEVRIAHRSVRLSRL